MASTLLACTASECRISRSAPHSSAASPTATLALWELSASSAFSRNFTEAGSAPAACRAAAIASSLGALASGVGAASSTRSTVTLAEPLALASAPAAASDALDDDEEKEAEELGSPAALMRVTSRESYLRAAWRSLSFWVLGWKRGVCVWGGG